MDKQTTKQVRSKKFLELEERAKALLIRVEEDMKETLELEKEIATLNEKEAEKLGNSLQARFQELENKFDNNFK